MMTAFCRARGCSMAVEATQGYCGRHGGLVRFRRELAELQRRAAQQMCRTRRPRSEWTNRGAPVGQGLSRCAKLDAQARERTRAIVEGLVTFLRWAVESSAASDAKAA